jgi:phosphatidate phosphatase PAH1
MSNGKLTDVTMSVGENGEAYFVLDRDLDSNTSTTTSPMSTSPPTKLSALDKHVDNIDISELDFSTTPPHPMHTVENRANFDHKDLKVEYFNHDIEEPDREKQTWSWYNWFGYKEENMAKNDFLEQEYLETLENTYGNTDSNETTVVKLKSLLSDEQDDTLATSLQNTTKKTLAIQIPTRKSAGSPFINLSERNVDIDLNDMDKLTPTLPTSLSSRSPSPTKEISPKKTIEKKDEGGSWNWFWSSKIETISKTHRPTSEQISRLGLKFGRNEIRFNVSSRMQGHQEIVACIYMYNYDQNLIISDIDGTITRSDVFGHILPMLGKDWSHSGIANLYSNIQKNGYQFFYLTSRSILQASSTRGYINSVKQDGVVLPEGPIISNPEKLFSCLAREVITKNPEEFKIQALRDVKALFPSDYNPFYAGFGNKINDLISYKTVGVPLDKIFTIDHHGVVKVNWSVSHKSYKFINELCDHIFPDINQKREKVKKQFKSFSYWKVPIPSVDDLTEFDK